MWIRIRAVIIEDEPLAAQYLAALLDDTCQVEVVGSTRVSAGERILQPPTRLLLLPEMAPVLHRCGHQRAVNAEFLKTGLLLPPLP
ncbi:MAG TPA: hypothetical protein VE860_27375 [Chthoniobacterales bacterium]|nr:hypothetical protein [Chthoniobacterales bacterium]